MMKKVMIWRNRRWCLYTSKTDPQGSRMISHWNHPEVEKALGNWWLKKRNLKESKEWEKSSLDQEKENIAHRCKQKQQQLHQHIQFKRQLGTQCSEIDRASQIPTPTAMDPEGLYHYHFLKATNIMPLVITGKQNPLLKDSIASHDLKK